MELKKLDVIFSSDVVVREIVCIGFVGQDLYAQKSFFLVLVDEEHGYCLMLKILANFNIFPRRIIEI